MTHPEIAYKPGWTFEWVEREDGLFIRIVVTTPDAKGRDSITGKPSTYYAMFRVPMPFQPMWLLLLISDIEEHERREWLKFDRVSVFNPHIYGEPGYLAMNRPVDWWERA